MTDCYVVTMSLIDDHVIFGVRALRFCLEIYVMGSIIFFT